ncbi:MAG: NAD(P)-binding domain-containing protein [Bacteroidota bacterium]
MKKIGIIGSGVVGKTLAKGYADKGHSVKLGTRHPAKLDDWQRSEAESVEVSSFQDAADFGDVIILAVKGTAAKEVVQLLGTKAITGKTIMDATNPISDSAPENGVLNFFTNQNGSLMEDLQKAFPYANFVKGLNSVGSHFMVDPSFEITPTMFIAGNDENAKAEVSELISKLGWEIEDMGTAEAARAIEPLCMLWCIPGFLNNQWSHAFKLLKANN